MRRVYLGIFLNKLSNFIKSLIPALLTSEDLIELNKMVYSRVVGRFSSEQVIERGLTLVEKEILQRHQIKRGKALVLFCGGGRDSIALAKLGFEVIAVDNVPEMIEEAKRNAKKFGVKVEFELQEVSHLAFIQKAFDYVFALGLSYSCIMGKGRRIKVLKRIRHVLKPNGLVILSFGFKEIPQREKKLSRFYKFIAYLTLGNLQYQLGDHLWTGEVCHFFYNKDEIYSETETGGFKIKEVTVNSKNGYGIAVLGV